MLKQHKCEQMPNIIAAHKHDWANYWTLVVDVTTRSIDTLCTIDISINFCPFCGVNLEKEVDDAD